MFLSSAVVFCIGLILALAGGAVGAAIGGNYAFVLTGFAVFGSWGILAATGSSFGLDYIAFGPFMGPHIAFAGGAAAAIYAVYKGYFEDGKDVNSPLAGLGKPDVLWVGGLFGVGAFLVQNGISKIPWFGSHTDSVALTVLISGIVARLMFGGKPGAGLFRGSLHTGHLLDKNASGWAKFKPGPNGRWLEWQEKPSQLFAIGSLFGIAAGGITLALAAGVATHLESAFGKGAGAVAINNANSLVFGFSAIIILFLITNRNMPVQHHVTNIAGLAAILAFRAAEGNFVIDGGLGDWFQANSTPVLVAIVASLLAGLMAAFFGELFARLWYNRGASHIDPPAAAIWLSNTICWLAAGAFGVSAAL